MNFVTLLYYTDKGVGEVSMPSVTLGSRAAQRIAELYGYDPESADFSYTLYTYYGGDRVDHDAPIASYNDCIIRLQINRRRP